MYVDVYMIKYCEIKLNLLLYYNGFKIILLKFMNICSLNTNNFDKIFYILFLALEFLN